MDILDFEHRPGVPYPLLRTEPHPCPYLPDRDAELLVAVAWGIGGARYRQLLEREFRRTGNVFYRPDCPNCRACRPIRVPVEHFRMSRSQRRVRRRNADLSVSVGPLCVDDDHFDVFAGYQQHRHDGDMADSREAFEEFVGTSPIDSFEIALRLDGRLTGVSIVDVCGEDALSSVYFYYDPAHARRSLGVYSGLCEIDECRRRGRPYWYIGYHVAGCAKMEYKARFRPCELLSPDGVWRSVGPPA
jgi:arginyl-tRNA--protein-N-Asp/Glu arginylyltransferase